MEGVDLPWLQFRSLILTRRLHFFFLFCRERMARRETHGSGWGFLRLFESFHSEELPHRSLARNGEPVAVRYRALCFPRRKRCRCFLCILSMRIETRAFGEGRPAESELYPRRGVSRFLGRALRDRLELELREDDFLPACIDLEREILFDRLQYQIDTLALLGIQAAAVLGTEEELPALHAVVLADTELIAVAFEPIEKRRADRLRLGFDVNALVRHHLVAKPFIFGKRLEKRVYHYGIILRGFLQVFLLDNFRFRFQFQNFFLDIFYSILFFRFCFLAEKSPNFSGKLRSIQRPEKILADQNAQLLYFLVAHAQLALKIRDSLRHFFARQNILLFRSNLIERIPYGQHLFRSLNPSRQRF